MSNEVPETAAEGPETPAGVSVESLIEAVAGGVLRAFDARNADHGAVSAALADQGVFAALVVYAGQWPTGDDQRTSGRPTPPQP